MANWWEQKPEKATGSLLPPPPAQSPQDSYLREAMDIYQQMRESSGQPRKPTATLLDATPPTAPEPPKEGILRSLAGTVAAPIAETLTQIGPSLYNVADAATAGYLDEGRRRLQAGIQNLAGDDVRWRDIPTMAEGAAQTKAIPAAYESQALKAGRQQLAQAQGVGESLKTVATNPTLLTGMVAESFPWMLGIAGPAKAAATAAFEGAITKGATAAAAETAAKSAAFRASVAGNFAISGGTSGLSAQQRIYGMNEAELAKNSPDYQALRQQGLDHRSAQEALAREANMKTTAISGGLGAGATALLGGGLEAQIAQRLAGVAGPSQGVLKNVLSGAAREGGEEFLQSGGERFGENIGTMPVDKAITPMQHVFTDAAVGALVGAVAGGAFGSLSGGESARQGHAGQEAARQADLARLSLSSLNDDQVTQAVSEARQALADNPRMPEKDRQQLESVVGALDTDLQSRANGETLRQTLADPQQLTTPRGLSTLAGMADESRVGQLSDQELQAAAEQANALATSEQLDQDQQQRFAKTAADYQRHIQTRQQMAQLDAAIQTDPQVAPSLAGKIISAAKGDAKQGITPEYALASLDDATLSRNLMAGLGLLTRHSESLSTKQQTQLKASLDALRVERETRDNTPDWQTRNAEIIKNNNPQEVKLRRALEENPEKTVNKLKVGDMPLMDALMQSLDARAQNYAQTGFAAPESITKPLALLQARKAAILAAKQRQTPAGTGSQSAPIPTAADVTGTPGQALADLIDSQQRRTLGQGPLTAPATPQGLPQGQTTPSGLVRPGQDLPRLLGPAPADTTPQSAPTSAPQSLADLLNRPSTAGVVPSAPTRAEGGIAGPSVKGKQGWMFFSKGSGTLGIPRAQMPQIKAEHRGAMVNFLNARGIAHESKEIPARSLKPTQAEFSPEKVKQANEYKGGNRLILVSKDGYILDGHHQWMASFQKNDSIQAIVLDAPIKKLLQDVKEFPSAKTDNTTQPTTKEAPNEKGQTQAAPLLSPGKETGKYRWSGLSLDERKAELKRIGKTDDEAANIAKRGWNTIKKSDRAALESAPVLSSYTQAELKAREASAKKAEDEKTAKNKAFDQKKAADSAAQDFVLSGSDRPADVAASRGQTNMLDIMDGKPAPVHHIPSLPVQEVPTDQISLSSEVPQFKSGANSQTGVVEPLGGTFERTGTAPIQLWRRLDGRLEVISGRHRLDLAQRSGEKTIPAQIHNESDGFNARKASILDAELNIRDEQGKVKDYVDYFQGSQISKAEAESRGLLARAVGKRAYVIATQGGKELIAAHRANAISDEAAVSIAQAAPNDGRLQSVAIKAVLDGKSITQAVNILQAVKAMAAERPNADTSGDMFGFDDSAMREAEQMATIASRKQRQLSERLAAIQGAAKRPELARKEGVDVRDAKAIQAKITELKREREAWDNWSTSPDLIKQIRDEINPPAPAAKPQQPEKPTPVTPKPTKQFKTHYALYNEKAIPVDYVKDKNKEFNRAAMRIRDNGAEGFVVTPDGKVYQVSQSNKTAKLITDSNVRDSILNQIPQEATAPAKEPVAKPPTQPKPKKTDSEQPVPTKSIENPVKDNGINIDTPYNQLVMLAEKGADARRKMSDLSPRLQKDLIDFAESGRKFTEKEIKKWLEGRGVTGYVEPVIKQIMANKKYAQAVIQEIPATIALREIEAARPQRFAQSSTPATITDSLKALAGNETVQALIDAGSLRLITKQAQLPGHITIPAGQRVAGAVDPKTGQVYLIAENIAPGEIEGFLRHEVGVHQERLGLSQRKTKTLRLAHALARLVGARQILGEPSFNDVLAQLEQIRKVSKPVQAAFKAAERAMANLEQNPALLREEALSYLVQNHPELSLVRRIIAAVRAFLYKAGIRINLTENDLRALAVSALRGASRRTLPGKTVVSKGAMAGNADIRYAATSLGQQQPNLTADELLAKIESGEVTDLSPEQWAQVQAAFLKESAKPAGNTLSAWFGKSKIKGKDGKPLTMYHGTTREFTRFDASKAGSNTTHPTAALGFFFTNDKNHAASKYGGEVLEVYLALENPYAMTDADLRGINDAEDAKAFRQKLEQQGYDGVIMPRETRTVYVAAFRSDQVKLTKNKTFTKGEADIRFAQANARPHDAALESALGKIGKPAPKPWGEQLAGIQDRMGLRLRQAVADHHAALLDLDIKAYGSDVVDNQTAASSWVKARMSKAVDGPMHLLIHEAALKMDADGALDVIRGSKGLHQVLEPLGTEVNNFLAWVAGNRAERLRGEERERLFTDDEIKALKKLNQGAMTDGRNRKTVYGAALAEFSGLQKSVMDIAEQAGLIDGQERQAWEHDFYVPFYRLAEDTQDSRAINAGNGLIRQEAFKKLKGGKDRLNDLLENTVMNWHHLLSASLKNSAARQALTNAQHVRLDGMPVAEKIDPHKESTKGAVYYRENGKEAWFRVNDPLVLEAITALDFQGFKGPVMKVLRTARHLLTRTVTVSPAFKVSNLLRDTVQTLAVSKADATSAGASNVVKGWKNYAADSEIRQSLLAGGGAFRFGTSLEDNATALRKLLIKGVHPDTILNSPDKIARLWDAMRGAWDRYEEVGDRLENANRAALYDQLRKQGKSHLYASFQARDLMDFSQTGASSAVRFLTAVVPFLNARIQGLDKLGRAATSDSQRVRFAMTVAATTIASALLYLWNKDDDEFKEREEWDRDTFWWFKIGGTAFRIPKPFEVGAIATLLGERVAEQLVDQEATPALYLDRLRAMLTQTFSINPIPQLVTPVLNVYANKDPFTGRAIETMAQQRLSPSMRQNATTSNVAKGVSAASFGSLSPVQADYLIAGYFGWVGRQAVLMADWATRPLMDRTAPDRVPIIGDFINRFAPEQSNNSKYLTRFYEAAKSAEQHYSDIRELMRRGDQKGAKSLFNQHRDEIARLKAYRVASRQIADWNNQLKMIDDLPSSKMTDEQRSAAQDALKTAKRRLARMMME